MSHQDIIQTLIEWIDEHIDQPLNIDIVARKSGYSKWYLQRMFRTVMHQTLGDYIRQRRLLLAAEALRTTAAWRLQIENRPGSSCCCRTPRR
ncbi:helix-turn-helix domain-containing protein, partial [Klebsiella pneumoniae]